MHTLLKSQVGSWPEPAFPQGIDLELEASRSRRRMYPVTVIYSAYLLALTTLAGLSSQLPRALRHLYHHSRVGVGTAYGITSDFWDRVFGTRIPTPQRDRLLSPGTA